MLSGSRSFHSVAAEDVGQLRYGQSAAGAGQRAEDDRNRLPGRKRGIGRIGDEAPQHGTEGAHRVSTEIGPNLLAQLLERSEYAQLGKHDLQEQRIGGAFDGNEFLDEVIVQRLEILVKVRIHQRPPVFLLRERPHFRQLNLVRVVRPAPRFDQPL